MNNSVRYEIENLYHKVIDAWNNRDAQEMAKQFSEKGIQIGFDGSLIIGREEILSHLEPIFERHPTAPFVTKVKEVKSLGTDVAILHAIAGMIPSGTTAIEPALNAHQTLVVVKKGHNWRVELFQNTPAQFHGRPKLVEEMTDELGQLIR